MNIKKNNSILPYIYLIYIIQGAQTIIISQGVNYFSNIWNININEIFNIIAFSGLGKFLIILISGFISDNYGRKKTTLISIILYVIFYINLLFVNNIYLLYLISFCGGAASSFLDGAAYPLINETFKNRSSIYIVLIKVFISLSTMIFPFFVNFILFISNGNYSLCVYFFLILSILVFFFLFLTSYKEKTYNIKNIYNTNLTTNRENNIKNSNYTIFFIGFSFFCMAIFTFWIQVCPTYAEMIFNFSSYESRVLISYYSFSSLLSCIFTSICARKIKDINIIIIYLSLLLFSIVIFLIFRDNITFNILNVCIGFFSSGGILQIGNVIFLSTSDDKKGKKTSIYNGAFSLSVFITPFIISVLISNGILYLVPFLILIFCIISLINILFINTYLFYK